MRQMIIILLLGVHLYGQGELDSLMGEFEYPDEESFYEILMDRIFSSGVERNPTNQKAILRQRVNHSSNSGWSILNRSRVSRGDLSATCLVEQDPGEIMVADHFVFCLSGVLPQTGTGYLLGDFQARWGVGYLFDQPAQRRSLSPSSLSRKQALSLRPHYSSKESDYFRGFALSKESRYWSLATFVSFRDLIGTSVEGVFKEDGDGQHRGTDHLEIHRERAMGMGGKVEISGNTIYLATILKSTEGESVEWGINSRHTSWGNLILGGDFHGNVSGGWHYNTQEMRISSRLYHFSPVESKSLISPYRTLSQQGNIENGIACRLQLRPSGNILVRIALDQALHRPRLSLYALENEQRSNIELTLRWKGRKLRLDYGHNMETILTPTFAWEDLPEISAIQRLGVRYEMDFGDNLAYTLNAKSSCTNQSNSVLVQQVVKCRMEAYRIDLSYSIYDIGGYDIRLGSYETSPAESFGFFTAYHDGQRLSLFCSYKNDLTRLELKVSQATSFSSETLPEVVLVNFQLSIVL